MSGREKLRGMPAPLRGRWALRDTVLEVRFPDAAPLRWVPRDGRLVPLAWDATLYGRAGLPLRRRH